MLLCLSIEPQCTLLRLRFIKLVLEMLCLFLERFPKFSFSSTLSATCIGVALIAAALSLPHCRLGLKDRFYAPQLAFCLDLSLCQCQSRLAVITRLTLGLLPSHGSILEFSPQVGFHVGSLHITRCNPCWSALVVEASTSLADSPTSSLLGSSRVSLPGILPS